jgi:hypothetical protein
MLSPVSEQSAKPYLVRAICEWCADNGLTPYIAVKVNSQTRVPAAFVKNGEIVLNIGRNAPADDRQRVGAVHCALQRHARGGRRRSGRPPVAPPRVGIRSHLRSRRIPRHPSAATPIMGRRTATLGMADGSHAKASKTFRCK